MFTRERFRLTWDTMAIFKELARPIPQLDRSSSPAGISDECLTCEECWQRCVLLNRQDALDYGEAALTLLPTA